MDSVVTELKADGLDVGSESVDVCNVAVALLDEPLPDPATAVHAPNDEADDGDGDGEQMGMGGK